MEKQHWLSSTSGIDDSALLKIEEASEWLGVGRSRVFELIGSGELRSIKVGRSRRITAGALRAFVGHLESADR